VPEIQLDAMRRGGEREYNHPIPIHIYSRLGTHLRLMPPPCGRGGYTNRGESPGTGAAPIGVRVNDTRRHYTYI